MPFDSTTINLKSALDDLNLLLDHLHLKEVIFTGIPGACWREFCYKFSRTCESLILTGTGPFKLDNSNAIQNMNIRVLLTIAQQLKLDSIQKKRLDRTASAADLDEFKQMYRYARIVNHDMDDSINSKLDAGLKLEEAVRQKGSMSDLTFKDLRPYYDLTSKFSAYKTHSICGQQDPADFITYELKIAVPRVELHWIQVAGHFPMFEQPDEFYKILNALVEKGKNYR
jgi:proline iminopeptidase